MLTQGGALRCERCGRREATSRLRTLLISQCEGERAEAGLQHPQWGQWCATCGFRWGLCACPMPVDWPPGQHYLLPTVAPDPAGGPVVRPAQLGLQCGLYGVKCRVAGQAHRV